MPGGARRVLPLPAPTSGRTIRATNTTGRAETSLNNCGRMSSCCLGAAEKGLPRPKEPLLAQPMMYLTKYFQLSLNFSCVKRKLCPVRQGSYRFNWIVSKEVTEHL